MPSSTRLTLKPSKIQQQRLDDNEAYAQSVLGEIADAFQLPSPTDETTMPLPEAAKPCSCAAGSECTCAADKPVQGLPVAGYKPTQPQWALDLVNVNKALEEAVLRQIDHLKVRYPTEIDQRSVAIAKTQTEDMFMRLNRAIFQPQRILSGPTSDLADKILRACDSKAAL